MGINPIYFFTLLTGVSVIVIATYVECKSIYVLAVTYGEACDRPLWCWLCVHVALGILREISPKQMKAVLLCAHILWTLSGYVWFSRSMTCPSSSPELYTWVEIVLMVATVFLAATALLPLTFYFTVMMLMILVSHGVISNRKAAREGTVDRLEEVQFDAELFAPGDDAGDDARPAGECCCCCEAFSVQAPFVRTPCGHYYHKECIGDWLKLARTCPLCRCDLEEVLWPDQP